MADQKQIFVKPGVVHGAPAVVRHPSNPSVRVPAEGCLVPHDSFTRKRLKEGGLVVADAPKQDAEPVKAAKPKRDGQSPHQPSE